MHISAIDMAGFMSHGETHLELPDKGIVLVSGPNGSGKSSIVEAVAVAAFGKTLRGTDPWAGKGEVSIKTDNVSITRSHTKGGSKKLKWQPLDHADDNTDYESNTKAQEALENYIGSQDVWKRTHVFSSSDANHFTMATDGQRKKLLETILGLGRFDTALAACRSDRKDAEARHRESSRLLEQLESQLTGTCDRVDDAKKVLETVPEPKDVSDLEAHETKLQDMVRDVVVEIRAISAQTAALERSTRDLYADAKAVKARLARLGDGDCDKCGQPIPKKLRDKLKAEADTADAALKAKEAKVQEEVADLAEQLPELEEERDDLQSKRAKIVTQIEQAQRQRQQREAAQAAVDRAEDAVSALKERIMKGHGVVREVDTEVVLVKTAEQVLGLKGVRAHVLGRALSGIELAANALLSRICGSPVKRGNSEDDKAELVEKVFEDALRLSLKPYTEKKTGGASDAISMKITGAGGGHGYRGGSGGERRRIDVALLLALAEVAQAACGQQGGTIFTDEVFDALDVVGIERVSEVLQDLAQDRTVVVISHNPDLQQALKPTVWFDVMGGEVVRLS